jgi:hypothetical protein
MHQLPVVCPVFSWLFHSLVVCQATPYTERQFHPLPVYVITEAKVNSVAAMLPQFSNGRYSFLRHRNAIGTQENSPSDSGHCDQNKDSYVANLDPPERRKPPAAQILRAATGGWEVLALGGPWKKLKQQNLDDRFFLCGKTCLRAQMTN